MDGKQWTTRGDGGGEVCERQAAKRREARRHGTGRRACAVAQGHTGQVQVEAVLLVADLLLRDRATQGVTHAGSGLFLFDCAAHTPGTRVRRTLLAPQTLRAARALLAVAAGGAVLLLVLVLLVVLVVLVGEKRLGLGLCVRGAKVARVCCAVWRVSGVCGTPAAAAPSLRSASVGSSSPSFLMPICRMICSVKLEARRPFVPGPEGTAGVCVFLGSAASRRACSIRSRFVGSVSGLTMTSGASYRRSSPLNLRRERGSSAPRSERVGSNSTFDDPSFRPTTSCEGAARRGVSTKHQRGQEAARQAHREHP